MAMRIVYKGMAGKQQEWLVVHEPLQVAIVNVGRGVVANDVRRNVADVFKESLRQLSPKLTGKLSRRWKVTVLANGMVRLRNPQLYAEYQNTKTRNKGFIRRGIQAGLRIVYRLLRDRSTVAKLPARFKGAIIQPLSTYQQGNTRGGGRPRFTSPRR